MPTKIVHNYFIFITFLLYLCYTLFHPCGFAFGRVGRGRGKALATIGLYFTPRNAKGMSSGMIMALKMTAARGGINHGLTRIYTDLLLRGVYVDHKNFLAFFLRNTQMFIIFAIVINTTRYGQNYS